jgi:hypothetical protein
MMWSIPLHSGLKMSPLRAKQWDAAAYGGTLAPNPYAGISLSES